MTKKTKPRKGKEMSEDVEEHLNEWYLRDKPWESPILRAMNDRREREAALLNNAAAEEEEEEEERHEG